MPDCEDFDIVVMAAIRQDVIADNQPPRPRPDSRRAGVGVGGKLPFGPPKGFVEPACCPWPGKAGFPVFRKNTP
jgi:hypothetical protein